tara:strand:- start:5151 stop:7925 length:2775 start_codon:yes stop_codon:yes gene_type:complete
LATGTGKTFCFICITALLNVKTLIVTSRNTLREQIYGEFEKFNMHDVVVCEYRPGTTSAEEISAAQVVIINYHNLNSLYNESSDRPSAFNMRDYKLVHFDEAHNLSSGNRQRIFNDIVNGDRFVIGYSATADAKRGTHGKSVYEIFGLTEETNPITPYKVTDAITASMLTRCKIVEVKLTAPNNLLGQVNLGEGDFNEQNTTAILNKPLLNNIAVHLYANGKDPDNNRRFLGLQGIVFSCGIVHSKAMVDAFNTGLAPLSIGTENSAMMLLNEANRKYRENVQNKGFNVDTYCQQYPLIIAARVDSQVSERERASVFERYRLGGILLLVGVDMITEGFDYPPAAIAFNYRPTVSPTIKQQAAGRVLRLDPANGAKIAYLVDFNWQHKLQRFCCSLLDNRYRAGTFSSEPPAHEYPSVILEAAHEDYSLSWEPERSQIVERYSPLLNQLTGRIQALIHLMQPTSTRQDVAPKRRRVNPTQELVERRPYVPVTHNLTSIEQGQLTSVQELTLILSSLNGEQSSIQLGMDRLNRLLKQMEEDASGRTTTDTAPAEALTADTIAQKMEVMIQKLAAVTDAIQQPRAVSPVRETDPLDVDGLLNACGYGFDLDLDMYPIVTETAPPALPASPLPAAHVTGTVNNDINNFIDQEELDYYESIVIYRNTKEVKILHGLKRVDKVRAYVEKALRQGVGPANKIKGLELVTYSYNDLIDRMSSQFVDKKWGFYRNTVVSYRRNMSYLLIKETLPNYSLKYWCFARSMRSDIVRRLSHLYLAVAGWVIIDNKMIRNNSITSRLANHDQAVYDKIFSYFFGLTKYMIRQYIQGKKLFLINQLSFTVICKQLDELLRKTNRNHEAGSVVMEGVKRVLADTIYTGDDDIASRCQEARSYVDIKRMEGYKDMTKISRCYCLSEDGEPVIPSKIKGVQK